jgi:hypothetical protein
VPVGPALKFMHGPIICRMHGIIAGLELMQCMVMRPNVGLCELLKRMQLALQALQLASASLLSSLVGHIQFATNQARCWC